MWRASWSILEGDVRKIARDLEPDSFDGVLTDPPYGLSFMGARWDYDVPTANTWHAIRRVLKPGAHLIAFGGTRTYHRSAVAIEDGGFEPRDMLLYLYGSGFPKSHNISKAIDTANGNERRDVGKRVLKGRAAQSTVEKGGTYTAAAPSSAGCSKEVVNTVSTSPESVPFEGYGTALKPAFEPAILARKPMSGTVAENAQKWGTGGLAIDACRIGATGGTSKGSYPNQPGLNAYGNGLNGACEIVDLGAGRWPANITMDEDAAARLDSEVGERPSTPYRSNKTDGTVLPFIERSAGGYSDTGGPSRFFYTAKVSNSERNIGMSEGETNTHPTLKPIDLCRYFASLILPPYVGHPRRLLVPYSGTGSEMIGALRAGWDEVVGIEIERQYIDFARKRIRKAGGYR